MGSDVWVAITRVESPEIYEIPDLDDACVMIRDRGVASSEYRNCYRYFYHCYFVCLTRYLRHDCIIITATLSGTRLHS